MIFWTLNPRSTGWEAAEWSMLDFNNEPSDRLVKSSDIAGVIKENGSLFNELKPEKENITVLYSPESMILQEKKGSGNEDDYAGRREGAHIKSVLSYYEAFQSIGISVSLKQWDDYNWSYNGDEKRMAILPNMPMLPSEIIPKLYTFVENGNNWFVVA